MEESPEHWDEFWRTSLVRYPHETTLFAIEGLNVDGVLEVGAGSGRDLQELHAEGHGVAFADWSTQAVRGFAKRNPQIPAFQVDARRLPFSDNSFDVVMSLGLLEHFDNEDRRKILQEQFRVAGRFVIVDVPQKFSPAAVITKVLTLLGIWPHGEESPFTYNQLLLEVRECAQSQRTVAAYGRELIPLPRNLKGRLYNLLPRTVRRVYVRSHRYLSRGVAGSFGIVFEKSRTNAG